MVPLERGTSAATAALSLPREAWTAHPHFPSQTLLLGSHRSFREVSLRLLRWVDEGVQTKTVARSFTAWKAAMRSHERYEEWKLYPFLERRWGVSVQEAIAGHHELAAEEQAVWAALDGTGDLATALRAHHDVLDAHLDLEETLVIPALLALTPAEFVDYYDAW